MQRAANRAMQETLFYDDDPASAIVAINVAPGNPYQTVPPQLLAGPSHFLSFSGIVRALSELWPFLAVAYTAAVACDRPKL